MPSVRSIILLSVLIFGVSIVIACLSLLEPPDSGGRGGDTYGTRGHGYRALFETLEELEVPVHRQLAPPTPTLDTNQTLVFLAPQENLTKVEPAYIQALKQWLHRGGRIVVAAAQPGYGGEDDKTLRPEDENKMPLPDVFESLELVGVSITRIREEVPEEEDSPPRQDEPPKGNFEEFTDTILEAWTNRPVPVRVVPVHVTGTLSRLRGLVSSISVPGDEVGTLEFGEHVPAGTLSYFDGDEVERHLVAHFPRGDGEIFVVSDSSLFTNRFLARGDNSVLAVHLLSHDGRRVVFDEFYHGLSVRGNPLYLFTRPGYAAVTISVLLLVGIWTWREAVFLGPPLPDDEFRRRDIGEYIDAMARFFCRGRRSHAFLLREVRDGVLHHLCQEVGLPLETHNTDTIVAALARRNPQRATRLEQTLVAVDACLADSQASGESHTAQLMQRITACL